MVSPGHLRFFNDYYKHLRTTNQIRATLASLDAQDIWVARGGNGVEARCRKSEN